MVRSLVVGTAIAGFLLAAASAEAAPQTYARIFSFVDGNQEVTNVASPSTLSGVVASAASDFNTNSISVTGAEASATAAWRDEWTVLGLSGTGTIRVHWRLTGTLSLQAGCPTCEPDPIGITLRHLFLSLSISSFGTSVAQEAQAVPGSRAVSASGFFDIPFTYGVRFGAGLSLSGGTGDDYSGGFLSFPNGATITKVELPAGASVTTTSGVAYNFVADQTPTQQVASLAAAAGDAGSVAGESLLLAALENLAHGRDFAVCGQLTAFVKLVEAQSGKSLPSDLASSFIASASSLHLTLGCR